MKRDCVLCDEPTGATNSDGAPMHAACAVRRDARPTLSGSPTAGLDLNGLLGRPCATCGYRIGHHPSRCDR